MASAPMPETSTRRGTASRDCLPRYGLGPLHVHGLEGHATLLDIRRDRVDDGVGPRNGGGDRGLIAHIGGDDRDPVEIDRLQRYSRRVWMPHSDAHQPSPRRSGGARVRRPRKPAPPNTTTVVMICSSTLGPQVPAHAPVDVAVGTDLLGSLDVERCRHRQRLGERQIDGAALLPGLVDPTNCVLVRD